MRPGAWLFNVSRGAIVDTDALVAAHPAGHLGGAGLDVTDPEPLPDGHPLWDLPNVIITPHVSATRQHERRRAVRARRRERRGASATGGDLIGTIDLDEGY